MSETITLMSDPRVAAIPVEECGEELVNVRAAGSLLVDVRKEDGTGAFHHLRSGVLDRLVEAHWALSVGARTALYGPRESVAPERVG